MKTYSFHWEARTLIAAFCQAFNDCIIKRFDDSQVAKGSLQVNFVYAPKQRVVHDLINKSQTLRLPVIAATMGDITRDPDRVFNKLNGVVTNTSRIPQPVPINFTMNMSILTRYQVDMDQILSNFIPWTDPYIVISWKIPGTEIEVRNKIVWSGSMSMHYPVELNSSQPARVEADTSFQVEGWIYKPVNVTKPGNIYKIDSSYTSVSSIDNIFTDVDSAMSEYTTKYFSISARPQLTNIYPYAILPGVSKEFTVTGKMLNYTTSLWVSGSTYSSASSIDYFSETAALSSQYPAFNATPVTEFRASDNEITFVLPSAVNPGFIEVIAVNAAGYGKLTVDSVRPTNNPYPVTSSEYLTYTEYQLPCVSGIQVLNL